MHLMKSSLSTECIWFQKSSKFKVSGKKKTNQTPIFGSDVVMSTSHELAGISGHTYFTWGITPRNSGDTSQKIISCNLEYKAQLLEGFGNTQHS